MEAFFTISESTVEEQVIDKSRFIGIAVPIGSEEEWVAVMQEIRDKYPNARHYVYAYRLFNGLIEKASDDGEPQGTGGRPVLDVLKHRNVWNTLIVVVRYFGGVLLGTGGLVRAYGSTARLVVHEKKLIKLIKKHVYCLHVTYDWYESLKYYIEQQHWIVQSEEFLEVINLSVLIPEQEANKFTNWIDNFSRGKISVEDRGIIFG